MTMNDEELFEHLQELVAELPAMGKRRRACEARAAAEVAKRAHYYEGQHELNGILSGRWPSMNGRGRRHLQATVTAKKRSAPLS